MRLYWTELSGLGPSEDAMHLPLKMKEGTKNTTQGIGGMQL